MEIQWPLVIFTLFVALTCGILGGMSILVLRGKGEKLAMTSLVAAAVSLVIGGIGSFLHLEHWERIFNGFGHLSSGITQELIGCVVLAIIMVVWFVVLRGGKPMPKALAWVTLVAAVLMMAATAHSYLMPARPAWGFALIVFYVTNACLLGSVAIWLIAALKGDGDAESSGIQLAFFGAILQVAGLIVYAIAVAMAKVTEFGHYADPTQMTTAPVHIESLANVMLMGDGAIAFWCSIVAVVVALACAIAAKRRTDASKAFAIVAVIAALVLSVCFRILIYQLGFPLFLLY